MYRRKDVAEEILTVEVNPGLLLVDEPTEGLAPIMVREVRNVLAEINEKTGVSILRVEQNLKVALSIAHRVSLMGRGRIVYSGSAGELEQHHEVRRQFLAV